MAEEQATAVADRPGSSAPAVADKTGDSPPAVADKDGGPAPVKNHGWTVTFAGIGINLALGILYTWSVIGKALPTDWTQSAKSWPYAVACLVFCVIMVPAGRMQDKIGPRITATIGGILVGLGMILCGLWSSPTLPSYSSR